MISATLLDGFCRLYAKEIPTPVNGADAYQSYRANFMHFGGFSGFDFFVRSGNYMEGDMKTSDARKRAMNWARESGVLDYVQQNENVIRNWIRSRAVQRQNN
jgi:hypothetical protein